MYKNCIPETRDWGKKLLKEAEKIVQTSYPDIQKISIIAWVGVREYFAKQGYVLEEEYMTKYL